MLNLLAAAAFFVGIHLLVSGTRLRDAVTARIGERVYLALFSLASLAGIVWLALAYGAARSSGYTPLWGQLHALMPVAVVVMLVAFVLMVFGLLTPNPGAVMQEHTLDAEQPARGILRVTRHPFLWGAFLWAATHLVINGDAAALILFGAFVLLTVLGTRSIDAKRKRALGYRWNRFAAVTSNVPFVAILSGRNRLKLAELASWKALIAVLAFFAVWHGHAWLFGVSAIPPPGVEVLVRP
ncbi:MAG: NnrU family protein [Gammaproteobacteria bacterium]|nr:NnrU family protein [Gammaproteobacteria bacterium]NIR84805.1 NnrU family protein [Gammaproteobacteria bacterium]NIR91519.1 NnrU family protein [Gammaproteobacteria bacterium]NIU05852.1 NnrU family protein [Gammaproteobacteria bacterium]NIV76707.1 NnrU family protein [Gammaproteobacteria bacterium]